MQAEREDYYLQTMTRTRALAARLHPDAGQNGHRLMKFGAERPYR
jgi:hypothetical protein